jgi:hypothetical protein
MASGQLRDGSLINPRQASIKIVNSWSVHQLCQIKSALPCRRTGNGRIVVAPSSPVRDDRINVRESKMLRHVLLVVGDWALALKMPGAEVNACVRPKWAFLVG